MTDGILEFSAALASLRPSAEWTASGNTPADMMASLDWHDKTQTRPTDAEITAEIERLSTIPQPSYVPTATILARLTDSEYTAIMQAAAAGLAAGNGQLSRWLDMARTAIDGVDLNSPTTLAAKASLIASGLLTDARAALVFSPAD